MHCGSVAYWSLSQLSNITVGIVGYYVGWKKRRSKSLGDFLESAGKLPAACASWPDFYGNAEMKPGPDKVLMRYSLSGSLVYHQNPIKRHRRHHIKNLLGFVSVSV